MPPSRQSRRTHSVLFAVGRLGAWVVAAGCAVKVDEVEDFVDAPIRETPQREEGVTVLQVDASADESGIHLAAERVTPCTTWVDREVDRTVVTRREIVDPNAEERKRNWLYGAGGLALGAGIAGLWAAGVTPEASGDYPLVGAGAAGGVGLFFTGGSIWIASKGRTSEQHVGPTVVEVDRTTAECDRVPIGGAVFDLGTVRGTLDPKGQWSSGWTDLDDVGVAAVRAGIAEVAIVENDARTVVALDPSVTQALQGAAGKEAARRRVRAEVAHEEAVKAKADAEVPTLVKRLQSGPWKVEADRSPVDDRFNVYVSRRANSSITGWPGITVRPELMARCKEGAIELVALVGMPPQVESGFDPESATALVRLDAEPAREVTVSRSTDMKGLFFMNPAAMLLDLSSHRTMFFRFTPHNSNPAETTFSLDGLEAAIEPIRLACGWAP